MPEPGDAHRPPEPWGACRVILVGGLIAVGFCEPEMLLVVSHDGRGLLSLKTGERLARESDDSYSGYDGDQLLAWGIGPAAQQRVAVAGLDGGHLPARTSDGWHVELSPLGDGDHELRLWGTTDPTRVTWSVAVAEPRAVGFSPSGRELVIATPADITLARRS